MTNEAVLILFVVITPLARWLDIEGHMRLQAIQVIWLLVKPWGVSPGRSITPSPGRILISEASNPNISILNEVLKETICASIWYRGQVSNIVWNILLAISSGVFPSKPGLEILVTTTSWGIGDPVILTNWNKWIIKGLCLHASVKADLTDRSWSGCCTWWTCTYTRNMCVFVGLISY